MALSSEDDAAAPHFAEVLKLAFVDGLGIRAIAGRLHMSRRTVRRILDGERSKNGARANAASSRPSLLGAYDGAIRQMLSETPELRAPAVLERLRPLGYRGGVTILRDRLRQLRPHAEREPFLTLDFAPGAAFFCLGCEDRSGAEHRAFEGADLPGESSYAGLEMFRCRPTVVDGHNLSRYYDITRAQMRRQGAGNTKAHQTIRALDRVLDESGRALPVSRADHDGKSRRARDLRFRGEA